MTIERVISVGAVALVVGGVAIGFVTIGPPAQMRERVLDQARVSDLNLISEQMLHQARDPSSGLPAVPRTLDPDTARRFDGTEATRDRATGQPYEYRRDDARHYTLCAVFARASTDLSEPPLDWHHGAGKTCFRLQAGRAGPIASPAPRQ